MTSTKGPSTTSRKSRPDGTDTSRYKKLERLRYREWAWEFLRRNDEFIQACENVNGRSDSEKEAVAKKFGLKRFKSYKEPFSGRSGRPVFDDGSVSSWSNIDQGRELARRVKIKRDFGEVVIRFKLAPAVDNDLALAAQLDTAERRLVKRLNVLRAKLNKPPPKQSRDQAELFGRYIRILDLRASNKTYVECAKIIFTNSAEFTDAELSSRVKNSIKAAKDYASQDYRRLALRKGGPKLPHIPLEGTISAAN